MRKKIPKIKVLQRWFWSLPVLKQFIRWTKKNSLPGFFKVPIYDVAVFIGNELRRFDLTTRANAISFSFFLSLFPALLAFFTLVPFFQNLLSTVFPYGQSFQEVLEDEILEIIPGNVGQSLSELILDIVNNPRIGLTSLGFILAIFFSSNGMMVMMRSFDKSYSSTYRKRNALQRRLVAIKMVGIIALMVIASVLLVILGNAFIEWISSYINADRVTRFFLYLLRWVVIIFLFYFGIATLYRQGAATIRKFNYFTPGATMATILSLLSSLAFSFYVDNFEIYNTLYGSIGTIIVVLIWIQINSFLILVGYELNASIAVNRDLIKKRKTEKEEF